jgi:hypothetical protein
VLLPWSRRLPLARPPLLATGLAAVALTLVAAYGWQRHLSTRLAAAVAAGQLESCLRAGDQLRLLAWLPGAPPPQEGRCRREQAARLWRQQRWAAAMEQQRQLLAGGAALPADRLRLETWGEELRRRALVSFRQGDLPAALAALEPLGEHRRADGDSLGDQLRQNWSRNRLEAERAGRLVAQGRWWEALDSLHRLDHPWWQEQSRPLQRRVDQAITQLKGKDKEHDGHGALPHTVPQARLEAEVDRRIAAGMDDWKAFEAGCQALGGQVVEAGPETICRRP